MALAPFFSRAYSAVGSHLGITQKELKKVLSGSVIGIQLGDSCIHEGNDKWIAEMLVNLLARLYPTLEIAGSRKAIENISSIALAINPRIKVGHDLKRARVIVCVGEVCSKTCGFCVSSSGWVAHVGANNIGGPCNPYGAGAAAALAASRVFQTIFTNVTSFEDVSLSLLDYGTESGKSDDLLSVDMGEVAVVGIGAVGNPAVWAWSKHKGLKGELHLVDPEDVELSNLQRYCLPFHKDARKGKVELAARELRNTELSLKLWPCSVEDFAENYDSISKLPTICVSVDNVEGRRTSQALLPRLVVNGWTSDNGLGASWHRFLGDGACLGCLYHPKGITSSQTELASETLGIPHDQLALLWVSEEPLKKSEIRIIEKHLHLTKGKLNGWKGKKIQDVYSGVICGQVGIDLPAVGRVATVPLAHQSVLAGIMMAAELVKRSTQKLESDSQPETLIIWDDVMRAPPKYWVTNRLKNQECFCGDEVYLKVFLEKWGD